MKYPNCSSATCALIAVIAASAGAKPVADTSGKFPTIIGQCVTGAFFTIVAGGETRTFEDDGKIAVEGRANAWAGLQYLPFVGTWNEVWEPAAYKTNPNAWNKTNILFQNGGWNGRFIEAGADVSRLSWINFAQVRSKVWGEYDATKPKKQKLRAILRPYARSRAGGTVTGALSKVDTDPFTWSVLPVDQSWTLEVTLGPDPEYPEQTAMGFYAHTDASRGTAKFEWTSSAISNLPGLESLYELKITAIADASGTRISYDWSSPVLSRPSLTFLEVPTGSGNWVLQGNTVTLQIPFTIPGQFVGGAIEGSDFGAQVTLVGDARSTTSMTDTCPTDIDGDGLIDGDDFMLFSAEYDQMAAPPANEIMDFNADGAVDDSDFQIFVQGYIVGACVK